ncbi:hypothetical protein M8C21_027995 [Ambrosia artemisiifolia]|uniref:Uncharacterized protein n=1 Tax=Ambrosia artemisiifolia TaxID=4212 RepID=A0AAD5G8E3_AMBAR|nr:hypothetical protein M8C21_027995 [Ambrosia artemisiifolia]
MFGPNEMKVGDHITITLGGLLRHFSRTKECGIGIVYEDDDEKIEEEDALGYYKSWNHIIGGDLSAFQLTTGEYALYSHRFTGIGCDANSLYRPFTDRLFTDGPTRYKERRVTFKAFSGKKKSDEDAQVPCDVGNVIQLVG